MKNTSTIRATTANAENTINTWNRFKLQIRNDDYIKVSIKRLTRILKPIEELTKRVHFAFFGRVKHHDYWADGSEAAAYFAYGRELLFEEVRCHDGADEDA